MVSAASIRDREAINIRNGQRLGVVSDIEIDFEQGKIVSIIIPETGKFLGFLGKNSELIVPWESIAKIGLDVILVDMEETEENNEDE